METIRLPAVMATWANERLAAGSTIALVPTMGCFHAGHLSLMKRAVGLADAVVVSLFVNPLQFGPSEDYAKYPRDLARDAGMAAAAGVDVLFAPEADAMYGAVSRTRVAVGGLSSGLCGASRPGHFEGVTTVVAKLFNIVKPQVAVFGRKDYQQLVVIRQMVRDLNWDVRIVGHPIVREPDGLAMSSRNAYLSERERESAVCLVKGLRLARRLVAEGLRDPARLTGEIRRLLESFDGVAAEYVSVVHQETLAAQDAIGRDSLLAMAVRIGTTRLIDNGLLIGADKYSD